MGASARRTARTDSTRWLLAVLQLVRRSSTVSNSSASSELAGSKEANAVAGCRPPWTVVAVDRSPPGLDIEDVVLIITLRDIVNPVRNGAPGDLDTTCHAL